MELSLDGASSEAKTGWERGEKRRSEWMKAEMLASTLCASPKIAKEAFKGVSAWVIFSRSQCPRSWTSEPL